MSVDVARADTEAMVVVASLAAGHIKSALSGMSRRRVARRSSINTAGLVAVAILPRTGDDREKKDRELAVVRLTAKGLGLEGSASAQVGYKAGAEGG